MYLILKNHHKKSKPLHSVVFYYIGIGYFKFWLDTMEAYEKQNNVTLTLETQNIINVKSYENMDFN